MDSAKLVLRTEPSNSTSQCSIEFFGPTFTRTLMSAQFFGTNAAWLFLGYILNQAYIYYARGTKDHYLFKSLVFFMILLAMLQTGIDGFVSYIFLVKGWGYPIVPIFSPIFESLQDLAPLLDALPAIFVQFFFTWRIWRFCMAICGRKVRLLVAAICFALITASICAFITAFVLTVLGIVADDGSDIPWGTLVLVWTVSTSVVDVTITICMIAILYHAKANAYFGETHDKLSRLLRLTIQTGFLTSILAVPMTPLYFYGGPGTYTVTWFSLGKSYLISLLANLNARSHQPDLTVAKDINPALPTVEFSPNQNPASGGTNVSSNNVLAFVRSIVRSVHDGLTHSTQEQASVDANDDDAQGHQGSGTAGKSITTQGHDSKEQ